LGQNHRWIQLQTLVCAALLRAVTPRVIDQDLPHETRGDRKKMGSVFGIKPWLPGQSQIGFMNQSRTLQSVFGTLPPQMTARDFAEVRIHKGDERVKRLSIPGFPPDEQFTYRLGGHWGRTPSVTGQK
jgi:hypothetical protein